MSFSVLSKEDSERCSYLRVVWDEFSEVRLSFQGISAALLYQLVASCLRLLPLFGVWLQSVLLNDMANVADLIALDLAFFFV